ncbi:MAG: SpoIIE family protein phosphatase [candidate division Zixibacteria bacterium]|nr:SpoIIE family protein phosphatase [candidate division Zixibacteria bacterium]
MSENLPEHDKQPIDSSLNNAGKRSVEHLLIEASHILNHNLELEALLKNILNILAEYLDAEASAIFIEGTENKKPELYIYTCIENTVSQLDSAAIDKGAFSMVIDKKTPLIINKLSPTEHLKEMVDRKLNISTHNLMAAPIIREETFIGVIEVFNKKEGHDFNTNDLEIMDALGEQIALAITNAKLISRAQRKSAEARSLYEVGKLMSGALELKNLLELIVYQVSHLVSVDVATIYIVDEDGSINEIVSQGVPEEFKPKLSLKIGQGICGWVAKTGQSLVLNDVSKNKQYIQMRPETKSEIAVPLISRDKVIGIFNVESDLLNAYTDSDLNLLETFASQAAVSIERAILYEQAMEQKALEEKLAIARRIQQTFLPEKDPVIRGFDIAGVNIPSEAVGGDYYDFIDIVKNQIGIAIGDVSGKGIGAALIMAAFRASLIAEIRNNYAIRTIFAKVNSLLYESIERENYVTAVYGVLDSKNRVFTFSNAGHNPPLLFKSDGKIIELTEGGLAIGMFGNSVYEERPVYINNGDMLLFYTDGVTEAQNYNDEEFGTDRLKNIIIESKDESSRAIINKVVEAVQKYKSASNQLDDLTMILLKCQ